MPENVARTVRSSLITLLVAAILAQQGVTAAAVAPPAAQRAPRAAPAAPTFSAPLILAKLQSQVQAVATGDLNGDGRPDIVAADGGGQVAVIRNDGGGRFADPVTYAVDGSVRSVVVKDLNGDGHPDIITTDDLSGAASNGHVAVLLNKGNGTFAAPTFYDVPGQPWGLAVADVTGDGTPDVVTTDYGKAEISVLAGAGDGTLAAAASYPDGADAGDYPNPQGVALGDFGNNGRLDAVVADGGTGSAGPTYVSYLSNDGHGRFGNPVTTRVANTYQDPAQILPGDFNHDGNLDYAVVIDGCGYGAGDVLIYLGDGSGTFRAGQDTQDGCMAGSALADVNGDGVLDLVSAVGDSFEDSNAFGRVLTGNGDGTFQTGVNYPIAPAQSASSIAVADLTGSGRPDLVIGSGDGQVTALFNESGAGPPYLTGTVRRDGQPVAGATVQACTGSSPTRCTTADAPTNAAGDFAMPVAHAVYGVTALPPAGTTGMAPTTIGPVTATSRMSVVGLDFADRLPPPGSTFTTPSHGTQQNTVPIVNWAEPSTYTTTGCKGGAGLLQVDATNTATGQPDQRFFPMVEDPPGSGTYVAHLPALAPLHGDSVAEQHIACEPHTKVFPDGGSPSGGTDVVLTGSGFTGAGGVSFGSTAAKSFRVLSDSVIVAVAPAGSGSVPVTVKTGSGQQDVGTFGYVSITNLSVTSGPAAGGTYVDIHGTGFSNVAGVIFGVLPATGVRTVSPTEVTAYAPPGVGTVQVQVVNDDSASAGGPASAYSYTGGPPGSASLVEGSGGLADASAFPRRAGVRPAEPADDSGSGDYGDQLDADCQQGEEDAQYVDIGQGELCRGIHEIINDFGPLGAAQNIGITSAVVGVGGVLAIVAVAAPEVVLPILAVATLVGFAWGLISDWNFLTDPSGTVIDTHGNPVANATATLQAYDATTGKFVTMPASSGDIDPAVNPQTTGAAGAFDWDAVAGTYRVTASAASCSSPSGAKQATVATAPFVIPPPVTGLLLTLKCPSRPAPKPTVTAISPQEGPAGGGGTVQIDGAGLAGATAVHFGKAAATGIHVLSPYAIQVTSPPGAGAADVRVTTAGGLSASGAADRYSYLRSASAATDPAVTRLSPRQGPTTGGARITITGRNFTDPVSVGIGGVAATGVERVSNTEITASVPPATFAGPAAVIVTSANGVSAAGRSATYDYTAPSAAGAVGPVAHLVARPAIGRTGGLRIDASWRLPRGAATAVACIVGTGSRHGCLQRRAAARSTTFAGLRAARTYLVAVAARNTAGDTGAVVQRRLDGVRITTTTSRAGHGRRLSARAVDRRTRRAVTTGRMQLWARTGHGRWRRLASVRIRHGTATARVANGRADYQWRYPGVANRMMACVTAIRLG